MNLTQLPNCQSYANIKDLKINVKITEQVSGTTYFERRIKGSELMSYLKRGDHIICSHLDRFSRNTLNYFNLLKSLKNK